MTELTPEFKAEFTKGYGRHYSPVLPDYSRCASRVSSGNAWGGSKQCARKNGFGPHGAYCKQHDPVAVKAKNEARTAKWAAEWDAKKRKDEFERACLDAVRQIAAGHNDPRGLCQSIIEKLETGRE